MSYESWSVVKEKRGIPMKMGVYCAFMSPESRSDTKVEYTPQRFNTLRYVYDYAVADHWGTYPSYMERNIDPFSGFTYTDARGTHNLSDNPAKAFDGTPNVHFNHSNLGTIKVDYYERMARIGASNNLQMTGYISDNGRGGNNQDWLKNMSRNNQLSGIVASNIYKVQISTIVNALYQAAPNTYQKFYCVNELFSHDDQIKNINEPYPLLKYFGLTQNGSRVDNVKNAHMNLATHIFQTAYDNLPASLKSKKCLYTGDWEMGDHHLRQYLNYYKTISDRLTRGAKIHGIGMQLGIGGQIGQFLQLIQDDMRIAKSKGFDIGVMEFHASRFSSPDDMGKLIKICLNQGVKFFNLHDDRTFSTSGLTFFNDDNTPTRFYNAVLNVFNTYDPSKYGKGESVV